MPNVLRRDWTAEEYFADESTSRSDLALFEIKGAATYNAIKLGDIEREHTDAMDLGTFAHMAILEPERWREHAATIRDRLVIKEVFEGKGARKAEQEWRAGLPAGSIVCTEKQREDQLSNVRTAFAMARTMATRNTPAAKMARDIIEMSDKEVTFTWTDDDADLAAGPMPMRCRDDLLFLSTDGPIIVDYKTDRDPEPGAFARHCAKLLYPWQAAVYGEPLIELYDIEIRFGYIMQRSSPPYEIGVRWLDINDIRTAREQVRAAKRALSACIASGDWSSPWEHETDQTLDLPRWGTGAR